MSTARELDPMAVVVSRPFILSCVVGAVGFVGLVIATNLAQVSTPSLMAVAVAALLTALALLVWWSSPFRAPLGLGATILVVALAVVALLAESLAQLGSRYAVYDNWGSVTLALVLMTLASFRSAGQVLALTVASAAATAAITLGTIGDAPGSRLVATLVAVMPPLAAGCASAAFARSMVRMLRAWTIEASHAHLDAVDELRSELAPAVREERLELLNFDIVPFLHALIESGHLTEADSNRARDLASSLRETMVDDAGSNWLDGVADHVDDRDRLAELLGAEQRGALTALIAELFAAGYARDGSVAARLTAQDDQVAGTLTVGLLESAGLRAFVAPYFAVVHGLIDRAHLTIGAEHLVVEFRFARG